jgi:acetylornithine deacetylase/succinyl-diaminopimelate desuccinylase-like protein
MPIYERPAEILQNLIRFDTTNPPGNETDCIAYIDGLLRDAGCETTIVGKVPHRTNLVSRLKGRGEAPPLLLYGHVDVVTTAGQKWQHNPFGGEIIDGYVWGRGALDMKGCDAMMIAAFLRARAEGAELPSDVILCMLSDEEDTGEYGALYMVKQHPHLFDGVRYGLGEFGGFSMNMGGQRFYPIMVAERRVCTIEVTVRGPGGHGALRHTGTAMATLGRILTRLDQKRLPVRIIPVVRQMLEAIAGSVEGEYAAAIAGLLNPSHTDAVLDQMGERARSFDSLLHNSVNPTIISGGDKVNVIPSEIRLTLDGRVLPGVSTEEFLAEVAALLEEEVELTPVVDRNAVLLEPDMDGFDTLAAILKEADPEGIPIPYLINGATDGRIFAQLGIQTYGFTPMRLPEDFNFAATIHAADERIPVEAVSFGADAIYQAIQRIGR